MTDLKTMIEMAEAVRQNSYAPYSNFHVGACIQSASGELFIGTNVENVSYGLTCCAEGSAISAMIAAGEKEITNVVVVGSGNKFCTPCGTCRQRIRECGKPNTPIHMFDGNGKQMTMTIDELLPESFGPGNLE